MKGYIKMFMLVISLLSVLTIVKVTEAATDWIVNPANEHLYKLLIGSGDWHASENAAVSEGAHLVTINDAAEQVWLTNTFGRMSESTWIGFTDEVEESNWVWISGEPVTYTNWSPGEPNGQREENYGQMYSDGLWNDLPVDWVINAIIEKAPDISGCIKFKGVPLSGRKVILKQPNEVNRVTKTNKKGCYKFDNVVPGKTFDVLIKGPVVPPTD